VLPKKDMGTPKQQPSPIEKGILGWNSDTVLEYHQKYREQGEGKKTLPMRSRNIRFAEHGEGRKMD